MKRLIRLFCLIAAATALGSCARDKVIPDEELARIFRDAYLINAYVSDRGVKLDSLELYEPVSAVTVTRPKMSAILSATSHGAKAPS